MMKQQQTRPVQANKSPQQLMQEKYKAGRNNLLLMLILTVVNLVLFFVGSDTMFLFSASIPYYAVALGWLWGSLSLIAIGAVILVVFFLCWLLSKKNYGWMIAALVLFALDTLGTLYVYGVLYADLTAGILDLLIHAWVLFYLVLGVTNGYKLAHAPQEPIEVPEMPMQPTYMDPSVYAQPVVADPNGNAQPVETAPAEQPTVLNGETLE